MAKRKVTGFESYWLVEFMKMKATVEVIKEHQAIILSRIDGSSKEATLIEMDRRITELLDIDIDSAPDELD
ncbi:hypothetical protein BDE36_1809 [Arcticibacter tournemirensis]|uniref:Uncharacterized protein n=1 Tax=Arcticibacter tournemirensis TaxID=699437 RepID=A0A5M9HBI1_9SPHI|nr:hypothetical protein [Arcticibacter tournemirensis]KAA8483729.1 hypothetical protein F1649_07520 [Arcticibacter tournemirensis]TQM50074.1 hypothetical protein BDE36_1809 [Arcticibacter tournemirensis]